MSRHGNSSRAGRRHPWWIAPAALFSALVFAVVLIGGGCGGTDESSAGADSSGQAQASDTTNGEAAERQKRPIQVNVAPVERASLIHSVLAEGVLQARKEAEIKSELTGILERLLVDEGSTVRQGDLLAVLDQREYVAALEETRARHLRALSELAVNLELEQGGRIDPQALVRYQERVDALRGELERGGLSAEEFNDRSLELELEALQSGAFRRAVLESRTGFAEARAAEERARLNLERTEIRAPFDGTITNLLPVVGERVYANQVLFSLVNRRELEAEVFVLESDLGSLQVKYPALLTIAAVQQTLPVRVSVVSPNVETTSRTCRVLFRFTNESDRIRPGMFARAEIATRVEPDRLLVPRAAVLERDDRPLVFKVEGTQAIWVYVQTGERNERYVEITGVAPGQTLEAGDRVVVSDHLTLAHEAEIKVGSTVSTDDPWRENFPSLNQAGED